VVIMIIACRRVRVNLGGYAYGGRVYFGTGAPLYYVEFADGRSMHVRAFSRKAAMDKARGMPSYYLGVRSEPVLFESND